MPPELAEDPDFVERFEREAKALAMLNHPNIVAVYDFGEIGGRYFLVMEYVEGTNLRRMLQAERLKPEEALKVVPQLCDALEYAHRQGVVHRDIKPENILLDRQGRVKIADFGLAKMTGGETSARITRSGDIMGTPHYMAPEQVETPKLVDHRADIYSMGVVFYEMLTGELPLGRFGPPSAKSTADQRLDAVVLKTLEKEPARRYQRAAAVSEDITRVQLGGKASTRDRRISWVPVLLVVCGVLFVMFAMFVIVPTSSQPPPKPHPQDEPRVPAFTREVSTPISLPHSARLQSIIDRIELSDDLSSGSVRTRVVTDAGVIQKLVQLLTHTHTMHAPAKNKWHVKFMSKKDIELELDVDAQGGWSCFDTGQYGISEGLAQELSRLLP